MATEDMTIDEALVIAAHANRHPAHVKHAALRVLAQAYKVERARAAQPEVGVRNGTEWGVRRINDPAVPDDGYAVLRDLSVARNIVARDPVHWELVNRIPPGPWQAAT